MKTKFLSTTALVAAGLVGSAPVLAAEWEIAIGGYYNQYVGFASTDNLAGDTISALDVQEDGEIHFMPSITLDNGLKFGVEVQLEASTSADHIDESFLFVSGSFGEILLGMEEGAANTMHFGVASHGIGLDAGDSGDWLVDQVGELTSTSNFDVIDDNASKIRYISPRFSGFQFAASYTPEASKDDGRVPNEADNHTVVPEGIFQAAANYERSFGDVEIGVSAGVQLVEDGNQVIGDDFWMAAGGITLGVGGFTISGAYSYENDPTPTEDHRTNVGGSIGYAQGPVGVSLGAIYGTSEGPGGNDDQLTIELGTNYALGPGVSAVGSLYYGDRDAPGGDAKGFAAVGGIALSF